VDLEGLVNRLLDNGIFEEEILDRLILEIRTFKEIDEKQAGKLAESVLTEVKTARQKTQDPLLRTILEIPKSGATMHDLGVGCRGEGDFFVHGLIADLAGKNSLMPPEQRDDAGAVEADGRIIVASVDGTHSRLSDFPFIAGFHVARAAMRDVMVKGGRPIALIDDLHLSDDGDVGKLFDFVAGVATVAELAGVPLVAGSTLRTGGDMVIGTRMVSGVGCIGVAERLLKRADVKVGDAILMTRGSGGGTIATTAIYSGKPEIVKETLNIDFIAAADTLFEKDLLSKIHAMLDVTNGGLRGDVNEVCRTAGVGVELEENRIRPLVNERVLKLLDDQGIDYLGVSLDSLLIFCAQKDKGEIAKALGSKNIRVAEIGRVVEGTRASLDGKEFKPKFRESAYTPIKKMVGEKAPSREARFKDGAREASARAREKMERVIEYVRKNRV
jgi:hydrogenase expression/formation protein